MPWLMVRKLSSSLLKTNVYLWRTYGTVCKELWPRTWRQLCGCRKKGRFLSAASKWYLHLFAYLVLFGKLKKINHISNIPKAECVSGHSKQLWFFRPSTQIVEMQTKSNVVRHNAVKHSCFSFAVTCVCNGPQFDVKRESIHYFVQTRRSRKKVEFSLPFQPGEKKIVYFFCLKPYIWLHKPHNTALQSRQWNVTEFVDTCYRFLLCYLTFLSSHLTMSQFFMKLRQEIRKSRTIIEGKFTCWRGTSILQGFLSKSLQIHRFYIIHGQQHLQRVYRAKSTCDWN